MTQWNIFVAFVLSASLGSYLALAQPPAPQGQNPATKEPMGFFLTSVGMGDGGNLGGLAGADRHCQELAATAGGGGKTWHAYLSTQAIGNQPAVNARDRIGTGPWYNKDGYNIGNNLAELHGDTAEQALRSRLTKANIVNEKGAMVSPAFGEPGSIHEALTGTQMDGRAFTDTADHTCSNWTSNAATGSAKVGHADRNGHAGMSWNSATDSRGCTQAAIMGVGSAGMFYCFAIN